MKKYVIYVRPSTNPRQIVDKSSTERDWQREDVKSWTPTINPWSASSFPPERYDSSRVRIKDKTEIKCL